VEVIAVVSEETMQNGILRHVMGFTHFKEDKYYLKTDREAFEHLSLVTAGMLSQTPGENHITAQIKEALEQSKMRGWSGNMVQEWISTALHVSKHIKNMASPMLHSYEIEDLSLRYLEAQEKVDATTTLMVLGSGMVGKGLIKDSLPKVGKIIWCYHVNRPEVPQDGNGKIDLCTFNDMKNRITDADVIVSAADTPGHLLHLGHEPFFNQERPVTVIDLGMPRNVDPALDDMSSDVTVVDLDGLKYWYRRELADMTEILAKSRNIISEHHDLYDKITNSFKGGNPAE
jgi:glutamyl-tRNA reductase